MTTVTNMKISELRTLIREEIINALVVEFETKDMAKGTSWKTTGTGWAAKNANGVVDYWYGKDEADNKAKAAKFAKDTSRKAPSTKK